MFDSLFMTSNKKLNDIQKSVINHKNKVEKIIDEIKIGRSFKDSYINILLELSEYLNIYIWKKNKEHLYEFSNINHCVNFLGLQSECVNKIAGLSDIDIIDPEFNSLEKICLLTDSIVKKSQDECNFIESGVIDKKNVLLYVKKIPIFEDNKFNGSIGIGIDYNLINQKNLMDILGKFGDISKLICNIDSQNYCYQILKK